MIRVALTSLVLGALILATVRFLHRPVWNRVWVRRALIALVVITPLGSVLRGLGVGLFVKSFSNPYVASLGALFSGGGAVLLLAVFLSIPFATMTRAVGSWMLRRRARKEAALPVDGDEVVIREEAVVETSAKPAITGGEDLSRRKVLEGAVLATPALFTGTAALGIGGAFVATSVHTQKVAFPNVTKDLSGLRILQISDLHLGAFITKSGVLELVSKAREAKPDLVVLTGDICDYLPWLEFALKEIETIEAPLGHFAVMGNHEYYRGAKATRAIYGKSKVRMLDDEHTVLSHAGKRILLVGVDDPMGWDFKGEHYAASADRALMSAPSDADLTVALCHRPSGFAAIAARGIDLTLSGHTHGAQAGIAGRSVLEPVLPEMQLWGEYRRGESALYTSSGAGHWATFRLGCPSEAPVIEIVSG